MTDIEKKLRRENKELLAEIARLRQKKMQAEIKLNNLRDALEEIMDADA